MSMRFTKKSRTIEEFVDAIEELVKDGSYDIPKSMLVDRVVEDAVVKGVNKVISDLLSQELANMLDNYFTEICQGASERLGSLPYHYTSRERYKRGFRMPASEAEAGRFVVVFGNGTRGSAAGLRFVDVEDTATDPMYLCVMRKRIEVGDDAAATRDAKLHNELDALPIETRNRLNVRLE